MKRIAAIFFVVGIVQLCLGSALFAQCGGCTTLSGIISGADRIVLPGNPGPLAGGDAFVRAVFYASEKGSAEPNWAWSCDQVFNYVGNRWLDTDVAPADQQRWKIVGNWQRTLVSGCPTANTTNYTTLLLTHDVNSTNVNHAAAFVILEKKYAGGLYNFSGVIPGAEVTVQPVPVPSVTGVVYATPNADVTVSWTEASPWSYKDTTCQTGDATCEPFWGYKIYYMNGATAPASSEPAGWTAANLTAGGVAEIPKAAAGALVSATIRIPEPAAGTNTWLAIQVIGAGNDGTAKVWGARTPFVSGFVSQNSLNFVPPNPAAIELLSFGVTEENRSAMVAWVTASEVNTAGFNILRSDSAGGKMIQVNTALIPSKGSAGGAAYKFDDKKVEAGKKYFYWLQEVENSGNKIEYGSVMFQLTPKAVQK